jgi:hypothetical protein
MGVVVFSIRVAVANVASRRTESSVLPIVLNMYRATVFMMPNFFESLDHSRHNQTFELVCFFTGWVVVSYDIF